MQTTDRETLALRPEQQSPAGPHICLVVPGLYNSGPRHWQSLWEEQREDCRRVPLGSWSEPSRQGWVARIDAAVDDNAFPIVFIAHSLGCLAVAWWSAGVGKEKSSRVGGALLVAPPDVDRPDAHVLIKPFAPAPTGRLPFPSILVASRNDRYAGFERLEHLAACWGSELVDVGRQGHINAESGVGDWPAGERLLDRLVGSAEHNAGQRCASAARPFG